jgi:predicted AAA+ superfamily ATPase
LGDAPGTLWLNADESRVRDLFGDVTAGGFAPYLAGYSTVVIDEAQRIAGIGVKVKILHDAFGQHIQFIATGSSSFDLANQINEPLTGRTGEMFLQPLTAQKMVNEHGLFIEEGSVKVGSGVPLLARRLT